MYGLCKRYEIETEGKTPPELWRELHEAERRKKEDIATRMGVASEEEPREWTTFPKPMRSKGLRARGDAFPDEDETTTPCYDDAKPIGRYHGEEEQRKWLGLFKEKYKDSKVEYAFVLTSDGEVYKSKGRSDGVLDDFPREKLKGAVVIHNHPTAETEHSFSKADYGLFVGTGMKTLYGIDDKYVYRFSSEDLEVDEPPTVQDNGDDSQHGRTIDKVVSLWDYYKVGYRRYGIDDARDIFELDKNVGKRR